MPYYRINGGKPLRGSIQVKGNKNGALPCLAATLLTEDAVTLRNIPEIEDVQVMLRILRTLGASVEKLESGSYRIHAHTLKSHTVTAELAQLIRASILLAGPLLARTGKATLYPPGGDVIGLRRLDTHFLAFESLGVDISFNHPFQFRARKLRGQEIFLDESSVTGTENAVMVAVLSEGTTVIENAASEPHVQDLCTMLTQMGARIEGIGSNVLRIEGVATLSGTDFTIGADFMEVGSFVGLAAVTGSEIEIQNVQAQHLKMIRHAFSRLGVHWEYRDSSLVVPKRQLLESRPDLAGNIPKIDDAPWPGFPPDLTSIAIVIATQIRGTVLIHEKMFESRMFFVDKLIGMGAHIVLCDPHRAVVSGPTKLKGTNLVSPDVRAGMALLIAALSAEGESLIHNIYQIDRGYERIHTRLKALGADIEFIE